MNDEDLASGGTSLRTLTERDFVTPPTFVVRYTQDWDDAEIAKGVAVARSLGMTGHELDLFRPLMNESGLSVKAHNATGDAAGLFQAMPATLRNMGYKGDWHTFTALSVGEQLPWLARYYSPYAGHLANATACYMATFCPAFLAHAVEPVWLICARDGATDAPKTLSPKMSALWYVQNSGLDKDHDGRITVADLTRTIELADVGPRWEEFAARFAAALMT